jgi:hypothetical protein
VPPLHALLHTLLPLGYGLALPVSAVESCQTSALHGLLILWLFSRTLPSAIHRSVYLIADHTHAIALNYWPTLCLLYVRSYVHQMSAS